MGRVYARIIFKHARSRYSPKLHERSHDRSAVGGVSWAGALWLQACACSMRSKTWKSFRIDSLTNAASAADRPVARPATTRTALGRCRVLRGSTPMF